ncbi:MAG: hypothetical protein F6K41_25820 [Symploca sp. SIO3E6]|nr:hypothetical protein [Caldora sp. SIO3E6]
MGSGGAEERRSGGAEEQRSGGAEERRSGGAEERRSGGAEERRSGGRRIQFSLTLEVFPYIGFFRTTTPYMGVDKMHNPLTCHQCLTHNT